MLDNFNDSMLCDPGGMEDRMEEKSIEKVEPVSRFVIYQITHLLAPVAMR
jgi:hypothetical protein